MRVVLTLPKDPDRRILQGINALREGEEYVVLEVSIPHEGIPYFRVEFTEGGMKECALFDSRAFVVTSPHLPPTWRYFQSEIGSISLRPESWNQLGFWESYYDHDPQAVEVYEAEKQEIMSSS